MQGVQSSFSQPKFGKLYRMDVSPENASTLRERLKTEAQAQNVDIHICHKENASRLIGFDQLADGKESARYDTLLVGTGKVDQWASRLTSLDRTISEAFAKYLIGSWSKPVMNSKLPDMAKLGIVLTGTALVTLAVLLPYKFLWLPLKCGILLAGAPSLISEWKERFQNWGKPKQPELDGDKLLGELVTQTAESGKRFNVDQGQWETLATEPTESKTDKS